MFYNDDPLPDRVIQKELYNYNYDFYYTAITMTTGYKCWIMAALVFLVHAGFSSHYTSPFPDETINYNEQFSWSNPWGQGRQDFGKYGGKFRQQFREAKYRGVPYPITWIAEYFIIDGEQIRWYRKFRQAGWYTHIIMWYVGLIMTSVYSTIHVGYNYPHLNLLCAICRKLMLPKIDF